MNKLTDEGLELIKRHEGWRPAAYKDPVGKWTIGYGHLIKLDERELIDKVLTEDEGEELLRSDIQHAENAVRNFVKVPLNDNEFSALVSFTFNLGAGRLKMSTLLWHLNHGEREQARQQFPRWVYGNGEKLPGLVTRRRDEAELFATPVV